MEEIAVNWEESIAYCNHVKNQLNQRIQILDESLANLRSIDESKQCKEYVKFYETFQEAYDLYFFWYLGHYIRSDHYYKQPTVPKKHTKLLNPYHLIQYQKSSISKHYVEGKDFWKHCISYLLKAL
jgi:hypothetical protein